MNTRPVGVIAPVPCALYSGVSRKRSARAFPAILKLEFSKSVKASLSESPCLAASRKRFPYVSGNDVTFCKIEAGSSDDRLDIQITKRDIESSHSRA